MNSRSPRKRDKSNQKAGTDKAAKPGLAARQAAAKLLSAVIDRKTSLDGMLDPNNGNPAYRALSPSDRALVRAILNSALRHLPRIDATIGSLLKTPLPEGARALHHVLVVAAAQILYLDVPDHSAVDLAVEQANIDPRNRRFAGLVNALLRRIVSEKEGLLAGVANEVSPLPEWFLERLVEAYGPEQAGLIAEAQLHPAALDLTVKSDPEGWAAKLGGVALPNGSVRLTEYSGAITDLEGYDAGEWWVQDAAAAIPARLFDNISGKRIVDLCAAPGGKTAQLVLMGARVTALDQSANRLKRLEGNLERLGLKADLVEGNAGQFETEELFDAALLDAPCSSTGTVRRHPDIPWTKSVADIEKLADVQKKLLLHALKLVKPGGYVVFSNCSLDPLEGEKMIESVLADHPETELVPVGPDIVPGFAEAITSKGEIRTTPAMMKRHNSAESGLDGFYACKIRRKAPA